MSITDILKWLFGISTEERKAKAEEIKARAEEEKARFYAMQVLVQEYRAKIEEQDKFIERLKASKDNGDIKGGLSECIEREMDLHRQIIDLLKSERLLKEEKIFLEIEIILLKKKLNGE